MAATATVVAQLNSSAASQTGATASFTPTANSKLVVVAVCSNNNHTTAKVWSVTGGGLTWNDGALGGPYETGLGANFDVDADVEWADVGASPGSVTVTVDAYSGTDTGQYAITVYEVLGSQPGVFGNLQAVDFDGVADPSTPTMALGAAKSANSVLLYSTFALSDGAAPTWAAAPAGWTRATQPTATTGWNVSAMTSTTDADAAISGYGTTNNTLNMVGVLIEIGEATGSIEQEGFRFYGDGTESGSTPLAAQDTNATVALGTRFQYRALLNATGDPAALGFVLRAQKNGAGGYTPVPVGGTTTPTLTYGASGSGFGGGSSSNPGYPAGITALSELFLVITSKPTVANAATDPTITGWTQVAKMTGTTDGDTGGYGSALAAETGNTNIWIYQKNTVTGSETGSMGSFSVTGSDSLYSSIHRFEKSHAGTVSLAAATGKDTTGGNMSITGGTNLDLAPGDQILCGFAIPTDITTPAQFSSPDLSASGITFGSVTERIEHDTSSGLDSGGLVFSGEVTAGSGTVAVTMSATAGGTTTNVRGPGIILRIRPPAPITNELYVDTSTSITAGGENTTARLTAPSGKTTIDFVAGRIADDANPLDAVNITVDDYTEVSNVLNTQSPAVNGDFWDLRYYKGTDPLDTYTVTGRITLAAAGAASLPPIRRDPLGSLITR